MAYLVMKEGKHGQSYVWVRRTDYARGKRKVVYLRYLGRTDAPGYKKKLAAAKKKYDLKLGKRRRK